MNDGLLGLPGGWRSGVKSIQRGTILLNLGDATGTATITSVNTSKSELRHLGNSSIAAVDANTRIALTDSTTITATRESTTQAATVSWELTEHY